LRLLSNRVIVALLLAIFIPSSAPLLPVISLPNTDVDQAVFVEVMQIAMVESCEQADGIPPVCQKLMAQLPPAVGHSIGSGTVVLHDRKLKVLTAGHVCIAEKVPETYTHRGVTIKVRSWSQVSVASKNYRSNGTVEKVSKEDDLCLIGLETIPKVEPARIAKSLPAMHDVVSYVGAPSGMMSDSFALKYDGRFSGNHFGSPVFAMPCAQGASGSSIRDNRGRIVSVVSRVNTHFHHICFGANLGKIRRFLK
jgi:hypothetical protein